MLNDTVCVQRGKYSVNEFELGFMKEKYLILCMCEDL